MENVPETALHISKRQPRRWLLGLDHLYHIKTDQLAFYKSLEEAYGDVVRLQLGPYRTWLFFHPAPIEDLLTRQSNAFIRFKKLTDVVRQWNGDSLLLAEGDAWRVRRRKVLPAFQTKRLPTYGAAAVKHASRFCDEMANQAVKDGSVQIDTDAFMAQLTLDIATTTLFGSPPLKNGAEIEQAIQILSNTAFRESTSPFTLPDWLPLKAKRQKKWAMKLMDEMVTGLVNARLADIEMGGAADQGDLLSMLIEHHEGDALDIRNDSMSLLIAGHETSGALQSWVFLLLTQHPDKLDLLDTEIETVLQGRLPSFSDLKNLKYLRAVIEETLRLYPPAYALFTRRAEADVNLSSVKVKKGDNIQIVPYTLHRSEKWFENAAAFEPARFIEAPTWPKYAYLPFGAGPRVCIGQNFGLMEACLVTATILQRWRPKQIVGQVVPDAKFSLRPKDGLPMVWEKR